MPLDERYCVNAKCYYYYNLPVARLGTPAELCFMLHLKEKAEKQALQLLLGSPSDLGPAYFFYLSINTTSDPRGIQRFLQLLDKACGEAMG